MGLAPGQFEAVLLKELYARVKDLPILENSASEGSGVNYEVVKEILQGELASLQDAEANVQAERKNKIQLLIEQDAKWSALCDQLHKAQLKAKRNLRLTEEESEARNGMHSHLKK